MQVSEPPLNHSKIEKMKHEAVKELIAVCEKHLKDCDARAKRLGLTNVEISFPIYRPMKKAIENINS